MTVFVQYRDETKPLVSSAIIETERTDKETIRRLIAATQGTHGSKITILAVIEY